MTEPSVELVKKHLSKLVSFNTCNPPKNILASGIVDYLKEQCVGGIVDIIDYGNGSVNILATKGEPKYLFNVHIDTVPVTEGWQTDPFKLVETDNKFYGLGACDIKGAAACMLACIEQGADNYAILFSSDEEHGNSTCIKSFLKEKHDYLGVVVAEPTQSKAVIAHRGIITASLTFNAESGHSSEPRALKDNSNHQAAQWITKAINWAEEKCVESYDGLIGTCLNIGTVEGGIKPNVIAPETHIKFGLRPLPGIDTKQLLEDLLVTTAYSGRASIGFEAPSLPSYGTRFLNKEFADELQLDIGSAVNFWTEASLFSQAGYPSIVFGPGSIEQAHTANEWVEKEQLEKILKEYWRIFSDD